MISIEAQETHKYMEERKKKKECLVTTGIYSDGGRGVEMAMLRGQLLVSS